MDAKHSPDVVINVCRLTAQASVCETPQTRGCCAGGEECFRTPAARCAASPAPVAHFRCRRVTSGCQYAARCGAGKHKHWKDVNQDPLRPAPQDSLTVTFWKQYVRSDTRDRTKQRLVGSVVPQRRSVCLKQPSFVRECPGRRGGPARAPAPAPAAAGAC